ncbi:MAG TPA: hypothetical protein ENN07_03980, partial [candidate division Zixibacteria bacterium]|nr:hypothetical protein [candidate division Zixibacteria bacterium]
MRFITIILCGLIAFAALADEPAKPRDCPACDLQLTGWTFGGLFGIGTFSADSDSPMVAEAMGIDELPSFAFRGGGGFYLYPGGKYRLGLLGGYTFSGAGDG